MNEWKHGSTNGIEGMDVMAGRVRPLLVTSAASQEEVEVLDDSLVVGGGAHGLDVSLLRALVILERDLPAQRVVVPRLAVVVDDGGEAEISSIRQHETDRTHVVNVRVDKVGSPRGGWGPAY